MSSKASGRASQFMWTFSGPNRSPPVLVICGAFLPPLRPRSLVTSQFTRFSSPPKLTMAQVSPLMASNDITVVVFPTKDDNSAKMALVKQPTSMKQKIVVGVLYTLVSCGFLYSFFVAFTFFGDFFTLLLAGTQNY